MQFSIKAMENHRAVALLHEKAHRFLQEKWCVSQQRFIFKLSGFNIAVVAGLYIARIVSHEKCVSASLASYCLL